MPEDQQTRAALIEAMAKKMVQLYTRDDRRMETRRDQEIAAELLATIEAHAGGCVVVPVELTSEMWKAWAAAKAVDEWGAMLAASPYAKEPANDPC